jgi:hypothetical protein
MIERGGGAGGIGIGELTLGGLGGEHEHVEGDGGGPMVDATEGVGTVVVGASPNAPPGSASAAVNASATTVTTPAAPAARRPPSETDRTRPYFPSATGG